MKRRWLVPLALLLVAAVLASGCRRKEEKPAAKGQVTASDAYRHSYGAPPTVEKGNVFAMVGYLPLAADPGKVTPLPLFLFSTQGHMLHLVKRLLSVDPSAAARIGVINPFPPGTGLRSLKQDGETMIVDLLIPPGWQPATGQMQQMQASLGFSLLQFPGVKQLSLRENGVPFPGLPDKPYVPDPAIVSPPGPPTLLGVVGSWAAHAVGPNQVSVFFDRPVTVEKLTLTTAKGKRIEGEQFRSIFDMALVVAPKDPTALREGMQLWVDWQVRDRQGRTAEGRTEVPLLRMKHP